MISADSIGSESIGNYSRALTSDIISALDAQDYIVLQQQWKKAGGELSLAQFTTLLYSRLESRPELEGKDILSGLAELFHRIDANSDGTLQIEEFNSFLIDGGLLFSSDSFDDIALFESARIVDETRHFPGIEKMFHFPELPDKFFVCDQNRKLKVYADEGDYLFDLSEYYSFGSVLGCEYVDLFSLLVSSHAEGRFALWDTSSYVVVCSPTIRSPQNTLCWSPRNKFLCSGGLAGELVSWSIERVGTKFSITERGYFGSLFDRHSDTITDLVIVDDRDLLISSSLDCTIRMWDLHTSTLKKTLLGHRKGVLSVTYDQTYCLLFSAGYDHEVFVWDPLVGQLLCKLEGHRCALVGVFSIPNTPELVSCDESGCVVLHDVRNNRLLQLFSDRTNGLQNATSFVYLSRLQRLIVGGNKLVFFDKQNIQGVVQKARNESSEVPNKASKTELVSRAYFNRSNLFIYTITGNCVSSWDSSNGELVDSFHDLTVDSEITAFCLDNTGRKFYIGDSKGRIRSLNSSTAAVIEELRPHRAEVTSLQFLNSQGSMLSISWDGQIHVYIPKNEGMDLLHTISAPEITRKKVNPLKELMRQKLVSTIRDAASRVQSTGHVPVHNDKTIKHAEPATESSVPSNHSHLTGEGHLPPQNVHEHLFQENIRNSKEERKERLRKRVVAALMRNIDSKKDSDKQNLLATTASSIDGRVFIDSAAGEGPVEGIIFPELLTLTLSEHLDIGASASNRDIYMFDARAGSILGNIRAHEGDIVSILWLGDLPVLVSSDTKGYIYFWATNPASNKCQCLLRILNPATPSERLKQRGISITGDPESTSPSVVSSFAFDRETNTLVTGDEEGKIRFLYLDQAFKAGGIESVVRPEDKYIRFRLKSSGSDALPSATLANYVISIPEDLILISDPLYLDSSAIKSIDLVDEPYSVLISVSDLDVRFWDYDLLLSDPGLQFKDMCIGSLRKNMMKSQGLPLDTLPDHDLVSYDLRSQPQRSTSLNRTNVSGNSEQEIVKIKSVLLTSKLALEQLQMSLSSGITATLPSLPQENTSALKRYLDLSEPRWDAIVESTEGERFLKKDALSEEDVIQLKRKQKTEKAPSDVQPARVPEKINPFSPFARANQRSTPFSPFPDVPSLEEEDIDEELLSAAEKLEQSKRRRKLILESVSDPRKFWNFEADISKEHMDALEVYKASREAQMRKHRPRTGNLSENSSFISDSSSNGMGLDSSASFVSSASSVSQFSGSVSDREELTKISSQPGPTHKSISEIRRMNEEHWGSMYSTSRSSSRISRKDTISKIFDQAIQNGDRTYVDKSFSRLSSVKSAESIFDLANEVQQGNRPGWRFIPPEYVAQHRRDEINTALEQAELEDAEDIFVSPEEEIIAKMEAMKWDDPSILDKIVVSSDEEAARFRQEIELRQESFRVREDQRLINMCIENGLNIHDIVTQRQKSDRRRK